MFRSRFAVHPERGVAALAISFSTFYLLMWASEVYTDAKYDSVCPPRESVASIGLPDGQVVRAEQSCRPSELQRGLMYRTRCRRTAGCSSFTRNPDCTNTGCDIAGYHSISYGSIPMAVSAKY